MAFRVDVRSSYDSSKEHGAFILDLMDLCKEKQANLRADSSNGVLQTPKCWKESIEMQSALVQLIILTLSLNVFVSILLESLFRL